ncbi:MAG: OmpA family protein, partial [Xanthomonadales bacterium]|nr:OmpA family protein [Xanthomonadales bacterium]
TAAALEQAEQSRRVADAQAQEAALARREAELAGAAADALRVRLANQRATRGADGMQMTVDDAAFGSGRSTLKPEALDSFGNIVEFVNREPAKRIRIEGHTDASGSANANLALSQRRAEAVRDALVARGVDGSRIVVIGVGSERPLAPNDSPEGRSRNRRVDVVIEENQ